LVSDADVLIATALTALEKMKAEFESCQDIPPEAEEADSMDVVTTGPPPLFSTLSLTLVSASL
jgi:hypothetical protein